MLPFPETELFIGNIAREDLFACPVWSLCNLKVLNPSFIGSASDMCLSDGHAHHGNLHLFTNFTARKSAHWTLPLTCDRRGIYATATTDTSMLVYLNWHAKNHGLISMFVSTFLHFNHKLESLIICFQQAFLSEQYVIILGYSWSRRVSPIVNVGGTRCFLGWYFVIQTQGAAFKDSIFELQCVSVLYAVLYFALIGKEVLLRILKLRFGHLVESLTKFIVRVLRINWLLSPITTAQWSVFIRLTKGSKHALVKPLALLSLPLVRLIALCTIFFWRGISVCCVSCFKYNQPLFHT